MATPTLAVSRYVEVGTYIGQFFIPGAGTLPNQVRVPCLVGKGERYIMIRNQELRRSFVYSEPVSFSSIAPFEAVLNYPADGNQSSPVLLYTADGNEITADKWSFVKTNNEYAKIQLVDSAYNPTTTYFFSYQSVSRNVKDPIPAITIQQLSATAEVREVIALSVVQDHSEFVEYIDFFMGFEVDAPSVFSVTNNLRMFSDIVETREIGSVGVIGFATGTSYVHQYTRDYRLECVGTPTSTSAEFKWTSSPVYMGNSAQPTVPLYTAEDAPTFTVSTASPDVTLDLNGTSLSFDFTAGNFIERDVFTFQGVGASLLELDPRLLNTNQFSEFSPLFADLKEISPSVSSTGSVDFDSAARDYLLTEHNLNFQLKVISTTGSTAGSRKATVVWSGYGTTLLSGALSLDESTDALTFTLGSSGIRLTFSFGNTQFASGDEFSFSVKAPRLYYKGKESIRNITFTIGAIGTTVTGSYLTDTPEGRYGQWRTDSKFRFEIPDGLIFYVRNVKSVTVGDKFKLQARTLSTLDFSLLTESTEQLSNPSEVVTDVTGAVTGTYGTKYFTLAHLRIEIISVKDQLGEGDDVAYTQIAGTSYLLINDPAFNVENGDIQVIYRWSGAEPNPSQAYFMTARYLRPESFYNKPILFLSKTDSLAFLAPSTIRNDLYIGASIAWDYNMQGLFIIQVYDANGDGLYSREDYKMGIEAFLQDRRATDLLVLNNFASLPDQLQIINTANDPFSLHESSTWIGAPIGTTIGSEVDVGSLVFLSRKTLAVYGQSPAHGSRILHGATRATKTITLEDKTSSTVTLDGSFVSVALAALNASFASPTQTILLSQVTSFDTVQVYTPQENLILGGNNIISFEDGSNGVYIIKEDVTTDPYSPDTLNINQMMQKQYVTKDIRITVNRAIVGSVFPNALAGVITLQTVLASRLITLVTNGIIGDYQDADGNVRTINSATDTMVFRDKTDPTLFHIGYNYFLATTAKRVFGLFTVNLPGGFPS